jgi:hypothetical protein
MEFGGEKLGKCRSTPTTSDLWIKTIKNATNSEIQFRAIFLGQIFLGEIGEIGGSNSWQPLL